MVFDYENLFVIGVLLDLNLKKLGIWLIWESFWRFEMRNELSDLYKYMRHELTHARISVT